MIKSVLYGQGVSIYMETEAVTKFCQQAPESLLGDSRSINI